MVFSNIYILVLWTKVALTSALEGPISWFLYLMFVFLPTLVVVRARIHYTYSVIHVVSSFHFNLMVFISDVCISSYTCSRTREECSDENASPRFLTTRWRPLSRRTFAVLLLAADTDAPSKDSFNARLTSAASRPGRCSRNSR